MTRADAWIRFAAAAGSNPYIGSPAGVADNLLEEFDKRFERAAYNDAPYTEYEQRTQSVEAIGRGKVKK